MAKVSMKFGSLTMSTNPGGTGGGSSISPSGGGGGASNLESVYSFSEMTDQDTFYIYAKNHLGRFINEISVVSVEGELPPSYDDKNTFYFIQDVEE